MSNDVPVHLLRSPTRFAINTLSLRFGLPNDPNMQDWQWEVADAARIDEFLCAYESGELSDDELFTLMETILQSFEELRSSSDPRWQRVLDILDRNVDLHAYSIWYWSALDAEESKEQFWVSPFLRPVLARHRSRLEKPPG
jgi:hypothetical protein